MNAKNIINIREARKNEIDIVGGKGANLGIMISSEIPVPDGFIVTAHAYKNFLQNNGITEIIHEKIKNINEDHNRIKSETEHIRNLILKSQFSKEMKEDIENRYNAFKKPVHLAVRSSATAEDLPDASFAGQQETYLNVMKIEDVFLSIKKCFASLWSIRSFSYRENNGYNHFDVAIAVVIQEMIESEISGILFTANPVSGEKQTIIDASYNLGEAIVSGRVTPDNYILDENGNEISFTLGSKDISIIYSDEGTKTIKNSNYMKERRCLNAEDLKKLFCEASKVENLYKKPMDIEWAIKDKKVYILQARPITTIDTIKKEIKSSRTYSKKEKEYLNNMIEHFPVVCYPLDFNIAMILQNMKYELFEEAGLKIKSPIRMDDMGIIHMDKINWKISGKILRFLKIYGEYKDNENNISCGEKILKTCEDNLKILEKEIMYKNKNFTFSEIRDYFNKLVEIHKKISYARFRYFLFPSVMIGEKLDKKLKKINSNYSEYDLLSELEYVTVNMNKEIDTILKLLSKNDNCMKDLLVESNDYMLLKKKYSTEFEPIDRFLKQYGWKSNYCCIPFSSISWCEDPNRFLNLLRVTMTSKLKDKANESNKYKNILKTLEKHTGKKELNKKSPFTKNSNSIKCRKK
ncbi:phosphoenolpyruvate synthase [Clostridiaceae bacterium 14S0207]|nr:phosphoenolpyruvate synthase [Clostridiaceae bacterium 14S0207]